MKKQTTVLTAVRVNCNNVRSIWGVTLNNGRAYFATTYPDSDLIFLTTLNGRVVSENVARKACPAIRAAITAELEGCAS